MDAKLFGLSALSMLAMLTLGHPGRAEPYRAGQFDYYVLVLGWSPTYCAAEGRARHDQSCRAPQDRAFTLHGLWPQYEKGWPQDCDIGRRPSVPQQVIKAMHDIMPSKNLVIHEYREHGTCSGLDPTQYYLLARDLYQRISVPPRFAETEEQLLLSPEEIETDFLKANPWLDASMISVTCRDQALLDVRVCFGRDLRSRRCGPNEARRDCRLSRMVVPPASSQSQGDNQKR
jgi:ribonuclease T2